MASIPIWLTGRHVSSVTARWQLPNAAGLLGNGAGTLLNLTGLVDEIDLNGETQTQSVVGLVSTLENYLPILNDDSFVFTEIMRSYQALNFLAALWYNSDGADVALVTVTRGSNTWSFYAVMTDYSETIRRPKSTAQLTLRMVDLGNQALNPSYA